LGKVSWRGGDRDVVGLRDVSSRDDVLL